MKLDFIEEPELEFGGLRRHVDIRAGLSAYGPLDVPDDATRKIRIGFVGTQQTIDGAQRWLERCAQGIKGKTSKQPNLFPDFPGFGASSPFRAEIESDPSLTRVLSAKELRDLALKNHYGALVGGVGLLLSEVKAINENGRPSVVIVAVPPELLQLDDDEELEKGAEDAQSSKEAGARPATEASDLQYASDLDLRHMLKAEVMRINQPIQLILPTTYGENVRGNAPKAETRRSLQDEATRAWNFHVALYYKSSYANEVQKSSGSAARFGE